MRGTIISMCLVLIGCCAAQKVHARIADYTDTVKKHTPNNIHQPPKGPKAIKHEMSLGFRLNTDGWSGYTNFGKVKALDSKRSDMFYKVSLFQLELSEKKDPKEEKLTVQSTSSGTTGKYIYGKINNFYALKLGAGFMKLIAGKPDPGAVSIHWLNVIGVSLGMLKPYYINTLSDPNAIKYSPSTESNFLNQQVIESSAGFSKGLGEMKFIPGAHFKSGLHFDFSTNRKNVIAAEAGVNVEYYSQAIALMANQAGTPYFVDLYVALQFGRRW